MTHWLPITVTAGLLVLLAAQAPAAVGLIWHLWRPRAGPAEPPPKAAVILCVRGADATLGPCLEGLLTQDYPDYGIVVIVDRETDPGWEVVQKVVGRHPGANVRIEPLARRLQTCSLKCSSLIQAVSGLDESHAIVALVDADAVPHPTWLRELVAPFADPEVDAAAGVRWYMPERPNCGAVVRYLWNVSAIVCMYAFGIAWGGTMALRREAFAKAELLEKWARAYCEDTMIHSALKPTGLKLAYAPTLVMVNRDRCRLGGFVEWCVRQMVATRLYHRSWPLIVTHGFASMLAWAIPAALTVAAVIAENWPIAAWLTGALAVFWMMQGIGMVILEKSIQRAVARRGEPTGWLTPLTLLKVVLAIPLTQAVYFYVLLATLRARRVCWRGVWYEVAGPGGVRRVEAGSLGE